MKPLTRTSFKIFIVLLLFACGEKRPISQEPVATSCGNYFEYDQVEHFHFTKSSDLLVGFEDRIHDSPENEVLFRIVFSNELKALKDTVGLIGMETVGFEKLSVGREYFKEINKVFCRTPANAIPARMCIPTYRDVLIFRRNGRIVGFARVCFECTIYSFVGTVTGPDVYVNGVYLMRLRNALGLPSE